MNTKKIVIGLLASLIVLVATASININHQTDTIETTSGTLNVSSNLVLNTIKWKDSPMIFAWPTGGGGAPALTTIASPYNAISVLGFQDNNVLDGIAQVNHDIVNTNAANINSLYTEIHCHVIALTAPPSDANRTQIQVVYAAAKIGGTLYGPITNITEVVMGTNTHHLVEFGHLAATNFWPNISGQYYATFKRIASVNSNFSGRINITADVHYPVDRLGSAFDNAP